MKRTVFPFFLLFFAIFTMNVVSADILVYRTLPVKVYRDKMKAGWVGQIAGVSWGAPTEFRWCDRIIPEEEMPKWRPEMINDAFGQDDLYVEMTFLRTLEEYGLDVCIRQAGIDFANSEYPLWCANDAGRKNLRRGIAPPDSSHPKFSSRGNDIDYQIEADFSGLIAPGMPNTAIALGEKFGRLMNYGDGMYAGQFIGGMYAEAFFEDDILKIIAAGLECIPAECQYAEMVRDVVRWYQENPEDWKITWQLCQKKYREDPEYQKASNGGIDVKINGAYILIGLLYGEKDLDDTIIISTRCGQDSDCNPSNAGGVLFTALGFSALPPRFSEKLDEETHFVYTAYNVPKLLAVCEKLTREILEKEGGYVETDENGEEVFVIRVKEPIPSKLELTWAPEPEAGSVYTEEEMAKIRVHEFRNLQEAVSAKFPGWKISQCGPDMEPGMRGYYRGKEQVLMTHPLVKDVSCVLSREVDVPRDAKTVLRAVVSHHDDGDWEFVLRINGSEQLRKLISEETVDADGWLEIMYDLSDFAGTDGLNVEVENAPNGWSWEAGYWDVLEVVSE